MIKYTILFLLCTPMVMMAQDGKTSKLEKREQIEALHATHITTTLNLTPDESTIFWPIYNEYRQKKKELGSHHSMRDEMSNSMTEKEGAAMVDKLLLLEENKLALKKELYEKLSTKFSSSRLITLMKAEHTFKKKMWDKIKKRKA